MVLPDNTDYQDEVDVHWSLAARLSPRCFIQPHNAGEVAKIVTTLVEANKTAPCKFAIRSGGHTTWAGAANIEDGVTVDLGLMNSTTYVRLSYSKSVLSFGDADSHRMRKTRRPRYSPAPGGRVSIKLLMLSA